MRTNSRGSNYIMSPKRTMMLPIFSQNWPLSEIPLRAESSSTTSTNHPLMSWRVRSRHTPTLTRRSGARVVLIFPDGRRLRYAIRLHFSTSNNTAEYEALINRLRIAIELGAT